MKVLVPVATTAIAALALLALAPAQRAEARIACNGPYQIVQGSSIATPYCEDNYVAAVARGYGMRVSDASVRNNPSVKAEACRAFGFDNRIRQICGNYLPSGRDGRVMPF